MKSSYGLSIYANAELGKLGLLGHVVNRKNRSLEAIMLWKIKEKGIQDLLAIYEETHLYPLHSNNPNPCVFCLHPEKGLVAINSFIPGVVPFLEYKLHPVLQEFMRTYTDRSQLKQKT